MEPVTRNIIDKRIKKINKAVRELEEKSSPLRIHAFRLEVKHLNSFLKLLAMEKDSNDKIKMPGKIEKAYKKTGKLRLIQLEKESILRAIKKFDLHEPAHYIIWLKMEEQRLKKSVENYLCKIGPLKCGHFINSLPRKIHQGTIQKFCDTQAAAVRNLLMKEKGDEKSLHAARKILKSLIYNGSWIKKGLMNLDFSSKQRELLKILESKIGSYHDLCTSLRLLPDDKCGLVKDELENISLLNIRKEWRNEKRLLMKEIDLSIPSVTLLNK